MARAKSTEQGRIKSKSAAVDEVNRGVEKLKDLLAQIEDLSREGFPYRDAVRARTELSLRETIRRIFGEKSEEYQTHKTHKLRTGHRAESAPTIAMMKHLIARLEQQKSDLLGVKSPAVDPSPEWTPTTDASVPTTSRPDGVRPADDESTGQTIQPTDSARTLATASAIRPSTTQSIQPAAEGPQPESLCATTMSQKPDTAQISGSAGMTAPAGATGSSDQGHTPKPESSRTEAMPAGDLVSPPVSGAREPADFQPSTSNVAASAAVPAEAGLINAGSPAPTLREIAVNVPPSTMLPASAGADAALTAIPVGAQSNEMAPTLSGQATSGIRHRPVDMSPVMRPASAPEATNGDGDLVGAPVLAKDSRPVEGSPSADMASRSRQASRHGADSVPVSERTRARIDPIFHLDDPMAALRKVCTRFHLVARQLRLRRDYRATLEVEDEYDVQDLLYALLRLEFDEVGREDWCPAYGDGATRTSYLLHKERIVVIAKKTKTGLTAKELAEQIKIDSHHYSGRADCRTLVCFIYDPEGRVGNPRGLESDLTMVSDAFTLEVIIAPK
jgi:hypothetical protein